MKIPSKKELLKELDKIGHSQRVKKMSLLGHSERNNPLLKNLLDDLEKGDTYEESLALWAAISSCDEERLKRAIKSKSRIIRNLAASGFFRVVRDNDFILKEIINIPKDIRIKLYKKLLLTGNSSLGSKLYTSVMQQFGYREALYLLPLCDEKIVEEHIFKYGNLINNWKKVTKKYPEVVLNYLKEILKDASEKEQIMLWYRCSSAFSVLIEKRSSDILEMAMNYFTEKSIPIVIESNFRRLVRKEPDLVFKLIMRPGYTGLLNSTFYYTIPTIISKNIRFFSSEQVIKFARILNQSPFKLGELLKALKPSDRGEVFTGAYEGIDTKNYVWPDNLMEALPHEIRFKEAERMLALRSVKENLYRPLQVKSCCDISLVRQDFYNSVKVPKAEERIFALKNLIRCTGLCRKELGETLVYLERIKNEQDTVRMDVFQSLSSIKPSLYREEHIPLLKKIIDFILEARDTSFGTRQAVQMLALSIMGYNAKNPENKLFLFSLEILRKLAGQSGSLSLPVLESSLPKGVEYKIIEVLKPVIKSAIAIEKYNLIKSLAFSLGKRAWKIKELQDMLKAATEAKPDHIARDAVELWLSCPETRDERVRELIKKDRSVITIPSVFNHIHLKRQEWLDYYLTGKAVKGKFLTGKTIYLLPAFHGFYRWLPRQEKVFASFLVAIIKDKKRDLWERAGAIKRLASMTVTKISDLTEYLKDSDVNIVESALGSLIYLDKTEGIIPILTKHLDDDRARVAMYTLSAAIHSMACDSIRSVIMEILGRDKLKITVYKELFRLIGDFGIDPDCSILKKEWEKKDLHRDVKLAILHSARKLLEKDTSWELLEKASLSSDQAIALSLLEQNPFDIPFQFREKYLNLLLKIAGHKDMEVRKKAFLKLPDWSFFCEEKIIAACLKAILNFKDSPEWREASIALSSASGEGKGENLLIEGFKSLMAVPVSEQINCSFERDLPERQRLLNLLGIFTGRYYRESVKMKIASFLKKLADTIKDPDLYREKFRLKIDSISWKDEDEAVKIITEIEEDMGNNIFFLHDLLSYISQILKNKAFYIEDEMLLKLIDGLTVSSQVKEHIALEILKFAGEKVKWNDETVRRLKKLRESDFITVRGEAFRIWTVIE